MQHEDGALEAEEGAVVVVVVTEGAEGVEGEVVESRLATKHCENGTWRCCDQSLVRLAQDTSRDSRLVEHS